MRLLWIRSAATTLLTLALFGSCNSLCQAFETLIGAEPPIYSDFVELPDGSTMKVDYRVSGELVAPPADQLGSVGKVIPEPNTAMLILAGSGLGMLSVRRISR